jgi:hypothetical protein
MLMMNQWNTSDKFNPPCSQWSHIMSIHTSIATNILTLIRPMKANTIPIIIGFKIGINNPVILIFLIDRINKFQHILPNKLIITI